VVIQKMGPMIQQMRTVCQDCSGKGEIIKEDDKCKNCKGKKVVKDKKVLQVYVDPGMHHGQKIVFAGEADEAPSIEPGDIIFVVSEKKHDFFKRQGNDLFIEFTIPLVEALAGFSFTVKHLDDRVLHIKSEKGQIINPGDVRCVVGEGMPTHKSPFNKGNLYIKFNVEFPKPGFFNDKQLTQLETLLPPRRPLVKPTSDMEDVTMSNVSEKDQKSQGARGGHRGMPTDEDEEESGGQRVQCAQQ